jgi:hypothetical protein
MARGVATARAAELRRGRSWTCRTAGPEAARWGATLTPWLRALSAREILRALASFGLEVVAARERLAKLRRINAEEGVESLTVPTHRETAPGTLHATYRQACRFVPEDRLRPWFYG